MNNRVPPQNIDAEKAVLGAMLLNSEAAAEAIGFLGRDPSLWYEPRHRHVYEAVCGLVDAGRPIDTITAIDTLAAQGKLEAAGGMMYLSDLEQGVPTSANVLHYAEIVRGAWTLRRVIEVGTRAVAMGYTPGYHDNDVREILSELESDVFALSEARDTADARRLSEGLEANLDALERMHQTGRRDGLMTGFRDLDDLTWGFAPGDLVVVAARPSVGKSAFALAVGTHVAKQGGKVLMFSLEMSHDQVQTRIICAEGEVSGTDLRTGFLSGRTKQRLVKGANVVQGLPFWVVDSMTLTPLDMRTKARKLKARAGLDLVIIDYLQLMTSGKKFERREAEVAYLSRQTKGLARDLGVPVILVAQFNRDAEGIDDGFKLKDKLRESGSIEQDADHIITLAPFTDDSKQRFLESEDIKPASQKWVTDRMVRITEAKHRNGPTGYVDVLFKKETQQFEEWSAVKARQAGKSQAAVSDEDDPLLATANQ